MVFISRIKICTIYKLHYLTTIKWVLSILLNWTSKFCNFEKFYKIDTSIVGKNSGLYMRNIQMNYNISFTLIF